MMKRHDSETVDEERLALACHFDTEYYLRTNPDVLESGVDPLEHFLSVGWRECRNPSRAFDVKYYLANNPDVDMAEVNPLLHYIQSGVHEGRFPRRPLDGVRRHLDAASPPHQRMVGWLLGADKSTPMERRDLEQALKVACATPLAVSISHDDYLSSTGGVQNVIGDEQSTFGDLGWRYLHLSPAAPLPKLANPVQANVFRVKLRIDGKAIGVATLADVASVIGRARTQGAIVFCVVHHLLGHAPELLADFVKAISSERSIVWVHDFFSMCPSYNLLRNDVSFCGVPPPGSQACRVCCYGEERKSHVARVRAFFQALEPVVLAPSKGALDLWCTHDLPHSEAEVVPLARVLFSKFEVHKSPDTAMLPLRVAHLGARAYHKGWSVFEDLALHFVGDGRYLFFQLGSDSGPVLPGNIRHVTVHVNHRNPNAMIEAIAEARIDVVVIWSLWPETFCFTLHEALTAGVLLVARSGGGNLLPAMKSHKVGGIAVPNEAALRALFRGNELSRRCTSVPRRRGGLIRGRGSAESVLRRWHRSRRELA